MRILLIEDDEVLTNILIESFKKQHYLVDAVNNGLQGWEYAQSAQYEIILTDIGLPQLDGISLCQKLRAEGNKTPILMMTAKDAINERILGLDAGADDYLFKPLDLAELHARLRALLRRREVQPVTVLEMGGLRLDPSLGMVTYDDRLLKLTPKEYLLLELFLRYPLRLFSRGHLLEHLWTVDDLPLEESVKAHVKGLRQKLKQVGMPESIENVYGMGYRFKPPEFSITESKPGQISLSDRQLETEKTIERQFDRSMVQLWQQYRGLMVQRLEVLQGAVSIAQARTMSSSERSAAVGAAHKLAGVLGMFGKDRGTRISQDIERLLETEPPLRDEAIELVELVKRLSLVLNLDETITPIVSATKVTNVTIDRGETSPITKIMVVDDDSCLLSFLSSILEPWGMNMTGIDNPLMFWELLGVIAPDLLILDVEMPQMSGIDLCHSVRNDPQWQGLPIIFLTARRDRDTIQQIFAAGADDYLSKPVIDSELVLRINNRLERTRLLQTFATKDSLTGLLDRPHSQQRIEELLQQAIRDNAPFSLAILILEDLDVTDCQYGYQAVNLVLQQWGHLLRSRSSSEREFSSGFVDRLIGYWGNGEFMIALPEMNKIEAEVRLESIFLLLRQQVFIALNGDRFQVNFRWGIVEYPTDGATLQTLCRAWRELVID